MDCNSCTHGFAIPPYKRAVIRSGAPGNEFHDEGIIGAGKFGLIGIDHREIVRLGKPGDIHIVACVDCYAIPFIVIDTS
ncbi:MAG: hypothetical protein A4E42_00259 [Methanoregulaceae archaeon PtaU1.Bin222]|nr:MAG: hypothetical protein A4E42_00259 [Methanoregulaceae archaeon PtaU1.Bin222]